MILSEVSSFEIMHAQPSHTDVSALACAAAHRLREALVTLAVAGAALAWSPALPAQPSRGPGDATEAHRALLDRYCVACHNQRRATAALALDEVDLRQVGAHSEVLEKVLLKLRSRSMPPAGRRRPEPAAYESTASWLEHELDRAAAENPNPGMPPAHRLNRTEYANAVRDILALEIDAAKLLPADEAGFGFDNIADTLSFSPLLLERYLGAARRISRLAVGDPSMRPEVVTYTTSRLEVPDERLSEEQPFGSVGGLAVRHYFPLDGEYSMRIELQRSRAAEPRRLDLRLDGVRLQRFELAKAPEGPLEVSFRATAGRHTVAVSFLGRTAAAEGTGPSRLPPGDISSTAGGHELGVRALHVAGPHAIDGRGDTPSRRRIFVCRPQSEGEERACAETILRRLARRAYRRPVTDEDTRVLLDFYDAGREGGDFDRGVQRAVERILVDPEFLFRVERDPQGVLPGSVYELADLELASRLSFFLWSSIPDDELLEVAEAGRLRQPEVLRGQVRRMLADARAESLIRNFAAQWLFLRNLRALGPDVNLFPEFDDNLRDAFQRETELFLLSQLREDRTVLDLLTADYTFVNGRLARHYGWSGIQGSRFRRVQYESDARAGLLGHGSVLAVTSYAHRTSPVLRGKWLLENILGEPPPPPPPNVPELEATGAGAVAASVRERLEQHRADPACATCHDRIDPLGFALENFDALGKWRSVDEGGSPIDASSVLIDGTRLDGPAELRDVLLARQSEFLATFTRKLMTYALGRGIEHYDLPAVRAILREAEPEGYTWSSVILGIVESPPFRTRRSAS